MKKIYKSNNKNMRQIKNNIKKVKKNVNKSIEVLKQSKLSEIITSLLLVISIIGLNISIVNIIMWKIDNNNAEKQISDIEEVIVVNESDNENSEIIEQDVKPDKFNPYWDYINMNLIDVDFQSLKETNKNTVGWIKLDGTNVNYPFVQGDDNEFYLNHTFDSSYNQAGWIFLDYRNNSSEYDKNTIIYGHSLKGGILFGTLTNILENPWLSNNKYHVVKLSTEHENTLWQVFSVYTIPNTSDYLKIKFNSDEEFNEFTDMLINRSIHDFNTSVSSSDKILTLSTCYHTSETKVVLHAKLIKRETK